MDDPFGILSAESLDVSGIDIVDISKILSGEFLPENDVQNEQIGVCNTCNTKMSIENTEYICQSCGQTIDTGVMIDEHAQAKLPYQSRIKILGPNSRGAQKELDKSIVVVYSELQKKAILAEYHRYNTEYTSRGGAGFSVIVIETATDLYHQIQLLGHVKRSEYKHSIMATCLWYSCLKNRFVRSKNVIANCLQLKSQGTAKGDDFVRKIFAEEPTKLNIEINKDITPEWVETVYEQLELSKKLDAIKPFICEMIGVANKKGIGCSSVVKSRVIGVTFILLTEYGHPVKIVSVCSKCDIRKNTIERFLTEIKRYKSHFVEIYERVHALNV
jgi:hypothetical protein